MIQQNIARFQLTGISIANVSNRSFSIGWFDARSIYLKAAYHFRC